MEELKLGPKVEYYRQQRQLPVAKLTEAIFSASTYSRLQNGKTTVRADGFIHLLERLELSFVEVINFNVDAHQSDGLRQEVWLAMHREDIDRLGRLYEDVKERSRCLYDYYHVLAIQIELFLAKHRQEPYDSGLQSVIFNVKHWTHKEIYLFLMIFDEYDSPTVRMVIDGLVNQTKAPSSCEKNYYLILVFYQAGVYFLKQKELSFAKEMLGYLEQIASPLRFLNLRFRQLALEMLVDLVDQPDEASVQRIRQVLAALDSLDEVFFAGMLRDLYTELSTIYLLPEL